MFENLDQPYRFNNNFKHNVRTIGLVSMGFILIVLYIQPLGINFLKSEHDGYFVLGAGILTAATLFLNTLLLPGLFPRMFNPEKWTIRKEMIWNFWMFANLFSLFTFMAWLAKTISFTDLPFFRTGALSLLPLILFNLISYNLSLKMKLVTMIDSGKTWLKEEINARQLIQTKEEKIRLIAENGKDIFSEVPDNILLIHSSGNYIEIFYVDNKGGVRKKLFRQSIAKIEEVLFENPDIKRCHRCWMVNLNKVNKLNGNSKGYTLDVTGINVPIPVSKNWISVIKEKME
jgi:hypothetical protein